MSDELELTDEEREMLRNVEQMMIRLMSSKPPTKSDGNMRKYEAIPITEDEEGEYQFHHGDRFVLQTKLLPGDFPIPFAVGDCYLIPLLPKNRQNQKYRQIADEVIGIMSNISELFERSAYSIEERLSDKRRIQATVELGTGLRRLKDDDKPSDQGAYQDQSSTSVTEHPPSTEREGSQSSLVPQLELNIQNIKKYINTKATDQEAMMFLQLCASQGMNPFIGDAYLVIYNTKDGRKANHIVSKDMFMKKAEAHPEYKGFIAGIVVQKESGSLDYREGSLLLKGETLVGGWATAYRGEMHFRAEVSLSEYDQNRSLWLTKKATMIRKVAIAQALREAFPSNLQGMYDASEMGVEIKE